MRFPTLLLPLVAAILALIVPADATTPRVYQTPLPVVEAPLAPRLLPVKPRSAFHLPVHWTTPSARACLAIATWSEARGRPRRELESMVHVLLNRTRRSGHAATPCTAFLNDAYNKTASIRALAHRAARGEGHSLPVVRTDGERRELQQVKLAVARVLAGHPDPTNGATNFYTPAYRKKLGFQSAPSWTKTMARTASIGPFVFYKPRSI